MKDLNKVLMFVFMAILYTYNFVSSLIQGKKNLHAVIEWVGRGYCFGLGLLIVFVMLVLLIKLFSK